MHTRMAWWAVGLAAGAVVMLTLTLAGSGGGGGGVMLSLAAFTLAVVAKARRERWALLWLPLLLFPALIATSPLWV